MSEEKSNGASDNGKPKKHHHIKRREDASDMEGINIPGPEFDDPNFLPSGKFAPGNAVAEKTINWDFVAKLGKIGCTQEEVAYSMELGINTLNEKCKQQFGVTFREWYLKHKADFLISLRRAQFRQAMGQLSNRTRTIHKRNGDREVIEEEFWLLPPSTGMQIWLGKQELGQKDGIELHTFNRTGEQPNEKMDWELIEVIEVPDDEVEIIEDEDGE